MVTTAGWVYLAGGTLLFFFWAYGFVSFASDVKNRFLPALRQLRARRKQQRDAEEEAAQREDRKQQLY
ncbi:hypothetical protein [Haladaptatus sp. CMSO5]|uniref:hypothetical protein n=1 Tax=Haladaptatus sp. CMSO5 TaxID=3120514 RepID=UPI002FCE4536